MRSRDKTKTKSATGAKRAAASVFALLAVSTFCAMTLSGFERGAEEETRSWLQLPSASTLWSFIY